MKIFYFFIRTIMIKANLCLPDLLKN
jgi:hypothetical protein